MSDAAWTITGFVLVGIGVLASFGIAPFFLMMGDSSQGKQYAKMEGRLVIAAVAGPPMVISGVYIAAIVLACLASGPTAFYPWIALVIAVPLWLATVSLLGYAKGNLMYWFPRSRNTVSAGPAWTGTPQTSGQALATLERWGAQHGVAIAVSGMRTDRFPYGWTIYAALPTAPDDPQAVLDAAGTEPVYLIGDSGAITTLNSGNLEDIRTRFCEEEIQRRTQT